jgi:hypothetical protein
MFMAIDQYGTTYHGLTHPRKDLLEKLCVKSASKIYTDSKDGKTYHVGYVIGGLWLTVYAVEPMRREA